MIRRGRQQGWLRAPIETLEQWSTFNGVEYHGIRVGVVEGHEDRGSAIRTIGVLDQAETPLMRVPRELIVSKENVYLQAKSDQHLRQILEAVGDFGQTARGAILVFMLVQATHDCPELAEPIGVSCPFSQYLKYLPYVELPTFWSGDDLDLLRGTSLGPAVSSKMKSLCREFEHLQESTSSIEWCRKYWWDEVDGLLDFDDWKQVDAIYRSRALEMPGIGDCMVPCVDMANHASGEGTHALYEADENGNGLLLLREGIPVKAGDEVTITYGDDKGACEMIFSYGFIEDSVTNARDILLELDIPDSDPLKRAKKAASTSAPGVRLIDSNKNGLHWKSDFIWLICINEEDGLRFEIAQTVDGGRELVVDFQGKPLEDTSLLEEMLKASPIWEVYQLRAVSILQDRVGAQLSILMESEPENKGEDESSFASKLILKLRALEADMLERFYDFLEDEKLRLFDTKVVQEYLSKASEEVEDFS